jgi:hypothetical protein
MADDIPLYDGLFVDAPLHVLPRPTLTVPSASTTGNPSPSSSSSSDVVSALPTQLRRQSSPADYTRHRHSTKKFKRRIMQPTRGLDALYQEGSEADDESAVPAVRVRTPSPTSETKHKTEEKIGTVGNLTDALSRITLPLFLAGLHPDQSSLPKAKKGERKKVRSLCQKIWRIYMWYVGTMLFACACLCIANIGMQARAFLNTYSELVLGDIHISVFVTWIVIRHSRRAIKKLYSMAIREGGAERIAVWVSWMVWFFYTAFAGLTGIITMGWVVPISFSAWQPSSLEQEESSIIVFNIAHAVGLYLIVVPWVFVFVGIIVQLSCIVLYMYICIEGLFGRIKHSVATASRSEMTQKGRRRTDSKTIPAMMPIQSPPETRIDIDDGLDEASCCFQRRQAEPQNREESKESDSYEIQVLDIKYMNGQDLVTYIDGLSEAIKAFCDAFSIPVVSWLKTGVLALSVGAINIVNDVVFKQGTRASVSRAEGLAGGNDSIFHDFQFTFYIAAGSFILACFLYPTASVTAHFERAIYEFRRVKYGVKKMDDVAVRKINEWSDEASKQEPGYYIFSFRMTGLMALDILWKALQYVAFCVFVQIGSHYIVVPD